MIGQERPAPVAEARVDHAAIGHNVRLLAGLHPAALMAVVKADGFGHGMVQVARTALRHGATWLGVTSAAEALALRAAGLTAPVLSWLHPPDEDFAALVAADVDVSVPSVAHLDAVAAAGRRLGRAAQVHLKADTGLSRNGARRDQWPALVARAVAAQAAGAVRVRGVWSHLASADLPDGAGVAAQVRAFDAAVAAARAAGLHPPLRHLANSAAMVTTPAAGYDLVRAGIAVYGVEPVPGTTLGLRPALTLRARVVLTKRVPAGTAVSYHGTYRTPRATTLALVPLGFADGVPRLASNRGRVLLHGRRRPIAGRVAMDQFVVDAGDLPVAAGDEAVLLGPGDRGEPTAAEWAWWARTNPHEILTGIGARVPRHHLPDRSMATTGRGNA